MIEGLRSPQIIKGYALRQKKSVLGMLSQGGKLVKCHMPEKPFLVSAQSIGSFLAYVSVHGGEEGLCLKYVFNYTLKALVFEGESTYKSGHAGHPDLAKSVWGENYPFNDIKGGYLHAKYSNGKFTLAFYSFSSTFTRAESDEEALSAGRWIASDAIDLAIGIFNGSRVITERKGSLPYTDPETKSQEIAQILEVRIPRPQLTANIES